MTTLHKKVVAVVIYTCYEDGTIDFTQDAVRKDDFPTVKQCFIQIIKHMAHTVHNAKRCPFNPENPKLFKTHDDGDNEHHK